MLDSSRKCLNPQNRLRIIFLCVSLRECNVFENCSNRGAPPPAARQPAASPARTASASLAAPSLPRAARQRMRSARRALRSNTAKATAAAFQRRQAAKAPPTFVVSENRRIHLPGPRFRLKLLVEAIPAMIKVADILASLDAPPPAPLTLPYVWLYGRQNAVDRIQNAVETPPQSPFPCAVHPCFLATEPPRPRRRTARSFLCTRLYLAPASEPPGRRGACS